MLKKNYPGLSGLFINTGNRYSGALVHGWPELWHSGHEFSGDGRTPHGCVQQFMAAVLNESPRITLL